MWPMTWLWSCLVKRCVKHSSGGWQKESLPSLGRELNRRRLKVALELFIARANIKRIQKAWRGQYQTKQGSKHIWKCSCPKFFLPKALQNHRSSREWALALQVREHCYGYFLAAAPSKRRLPGRCKPQKQAAASLLCLICLITAVQAPAWIKSVLQITSENMDLRFSCQVLFARNTSRKWTCCWLDPSLSSCPTEPGTKAHLGATFLCKWASKTRGLARGSFRQCAHHVCSCAHHVWCPRCPRKFLLRNLLRKEYIVSSVLPQGHRAKYSSHP